MFRSLSCVRAGAATTKHLSELREIDQQLYLSFSVALGGYRLPKASQGDAGPIGKYVGLLPLADFSLVRTGERESRLWGLKIKSSKNENSQTTKNRF